MTSVLTGSLMPIPGSHVQRNCWAKYRYRDNIKTTFESAKASALQALNNCPNDTIRCFINWSDRFMSAYRKGLTGKAAAWAVRKQRSHRTVPESACIAIESYLTEHIVHIHSIRSCEAAKQTNTTRFEPPKLAKHKSRPSGSRGG